MAVSCNTGYSELTKLGTGAAADAFKYIAVGTGTGQGAAHTKLAAETVVTDMTRVTCGSITTAKTTVDDDTMTYVHTFTAGDSVTVTEAGIFNNATKDLGDMLMVGDLSTSAAMIKSDTLKLTATCQIKAD